MAEKKTIKTNPSLKTPLYLFSDFSAIFNLNYPNRNNRAKANTLYLQESAVYFSAIGKDYQQNADSSVFTKKDAFCNWARSVFFSSSKVNS